MRLFGIEADGSFKEYVSTPFQLGHEERVLEAWLESAVSTTNQYGLKEQA